LSLLQYDPRKRLGLNGLIEKIGEEIEAGRRQNQSKRSKLRSVKSSVSNSNFSRNYPVSLEPSNVSITSVVSPTAADLFVEAEEQWWK
jgi:hypothetical protein